MTKEMEMEVDENVLSNYSLAQLESAMNKQLRKGDYWFIISATWFEQLKTFLKTRDHIHNPGPINNKDLLTTSFGKPCQLKSHLQENHDIVYIPQELWSILVASFGLVEDNHCIRRSVIEQGSVKSNPVIEVYPMELKLCLHGTKEDIKQCTFSRTTTLKDLEEYARNLYNIESNRESQLWADGTLINPPDESSSKKNNDVTLAEAGLHSGSIVTLELRNHDGSWPSSRPRFGTIATRSSKCTPGLCGLMNLGNTCFMNSALQCMSNTPTLTEYFLCDKHLSELNTENPLGMGGEIARTYGDLIKHMWSGSHTCLSPREFKSAVGKFSPTFSGFQQQDCQELMAFLLDGLHEDLNRVKKKPYIQIKQDIDRRPDPVVAQESWSNYKKRNDSIIVDTFHGLLKSTLVCPECELVSVTFDPYCYLSLPLPVKREKPVDVTFVPAQTFTHGPEKKPKSLIRITRLMVPKEGTASEIANAVAKVVSECKELNGRPVNPCNLIVAEVLDKRFTKVYSSDDYYIQLNDVRVYEKLENHYAHPVYLREHKHGLFGAPFFINVKERTHDALYTAIKNHVLENYVMPDTTCPVASDAGGDDEVDSKSTKSASDVNHQDESMEMNEQGERVGETVDKSSALSFEIKLVNSFGSLELNKLVKDKPLPIEAKSYLAADFEFALVKLSDDDFAIKINFKNSASGGKNVYNLSECLEQFTNTERLGEHDPWYCPRCKKQQQATKKFDLWSLPKVSIIHLKRFSYSKYWRDKLDTFVNFPIQDLDLGQYLINNPKKEKIMYNLIAVANHYGGLGGGHYTAYGKNKETGLWYYFDDSNVSQANEEAVISKAAYVLFYVRQD